MCTFKPSEIRTAYCGPNGVLRRLAVFCGECCIIEVLDCRGFTVFTFGGGPVDRNGVDGDEHFLRIPLYVCVYCVGETCKLWREQCTMSAVCN
jgi:hypothetical protein